MTAPQTSVPTTMVAGVVGQLADLYTIEHGDIISVTSTEASAEIAFGLAVKRGTTDDTALLLTAIANTVLGVVVHSHLFSKPDELGTTGLKPGVTFDVLRAGRLYVICEENVTPTSGVHVRALASGGNTTIGQFRATADGTNSIDISAFAQWMTTTTAGDIAVLEVNFQGA